MPRRHLLWILLAFAVSVGVRSPLIDRPLSAHHEYCTALVLIILHNWQVDGFMHHHGAPAITFSGPADLIPPGYTDAPGLRDGVLYYLSHPPLAYDLPHMLFTLTGSAPNALGLQLFNLLFHLLTAIALYLIVRELLTVGSLVPSGVEAPLFAAVLYLFMPASLWFHSNVYMSDMFVQNGWVWHILVVLRMYRSNATGWKWPLLAGLTLFITTCISWPGVWAGVMLFFIAFLRWWRSRDGQELRVMLMAVLGVGLALGYTAWRWLQVVDADALIAYFTGRYADRGTAVGSGLWSRLVEVLANYRTGYLPVILVALGLALFRWRSVKAASAHWWLFLLLAAGPVLLDHMLLLQYAGHDFAALKGGILLCALAAIGLSVLRARWAVGGLIATCIAGMLYFYRTNPIGSRDDERFTTQQEQGLGIGRAAKSDEMVFTIGFTPEPQVQWYAERTLFRVDGVPQAKDLLRAQGIERGLVVTDHSGLQTMERITAE
ncbi:MAG: hypothetical protein IPL52_14910 [Flavobacteriales bacterium]|nr:hypothetical protein [Flavobacteriales bacterium]